MENISTPQFCFLHMLDYTCIHMYCKLSGFKMTIKVCFFNTLLFPALSPLVLSVISMELLSPHKMGEIRPRHSNEGRPDSRIQLPKGNLHHRSHQNSMYFGKLPTRMYTWVGYLFNESFTSCEENIPSLNISSNQIVPTHLRYHFS